MLKDRPIAATRRTAFLNAATIIGGSQEGEKPTPPHVKDPKAFRRAMDAAEALERIAAHPRQTAFPKTDGRHEPL